jgi:hypothetical protein
MMAAKGKVPHTFDIIEVFETPQLCFPENKIAKRKITISRWFGGDHFYLQGQDKVIFSREKFDTLDEAMREAGAYALEENINVAVAQFIYTSEGG